MKSLGKRALSAALALCLMLFVLPLSAAAAPAGVTVTTPSIGGSTARLVTVTMTENRTADVALADGTIHNDSPAATLINRVTWDGNSTIVAAINGGFFNSYYNTGAALSYPGNCARIYSMVMYNGQLVNAVGQGNALGFTWEGEPYIDRVSFTPKVRLNGSVDLGIWAVNSYLTDPNAVCLFTPQVTLPYSVPAACRVVTVRNNVVTAISGGGRLSIPADGFVIVYNATAASNAVSWNSFPAVGTSAARFTVNTSTRTADQAAWNNMKTVVTGGRMLVQNGASVVDSAYYNATITAADQTSDSVAQRSFAAVLRNGQLVLGTATASFRQIANYLVSLGAKDAVSLDGGASSMLYVPGNGFLTAPGRELASALVIVDEAVHEGRPATIPQGDPTPGGGTGGTTLGPNDPSPWAEDAVTRGDALGLIPDWMQYGYRNHLTRAEFCQLIVKLLEKKTGMTVDQFRGQQGLPYVDEFSDTDDYFVCSCSSLGIVQGTGGGRFQPAASLTRQEAATILRRTAQALGAQPTGAGKTFTDQAQIADWAKDAVDYVTAVGIMNGDGATFRPNGTFTREEGFITMVNAYDEI